MDRLDGRTACFFAIGLLVLTFGCHGGAVFHGLGHGIASAARVSGAVARVGAVNAGRVVAATGKAVAMSGLARSRADVVNEGGPVPETSCAVLCPTSLDGRRVYVCAELQTIVDRDNRVREIYACDEQPLSMR